MTSNCMIEVFNIKYIDILQTFIVFKLHQNSHIFVIKKNHYCWDAGIDRPFFLPRQNQKIIILATENTISKRRRSWKEWPMETQQ